MSDRPRFDALVVGAGIAGLQAALDLADQGFSVAMVEKNPSIGGAMIGLSKVFPTLDCSSCITTPKMAAAAHHQNITIYTYTELRSVQRDGQLFQALLHRKPRYVDEVECIGCRQCEYECPVETEDEFDGRLGARRAVYIPFTNAIPQTALVDVEHCTLCGRCVTACPTDAIVLDQQPVEVEVEASVVVATTGWQLTPAGAKVEYGAGMIANVLAPTQMERLLAPHGPYGRVLRPSDGKVPESIAYVQCAGSRDESLGVPYCSRVCCMYAIKQAMLLSGALPVAEITIYYMDIRAFGKGYEEFYRTAQAMGIQFVKGKVARLTETEDQGVQVRVERIDQLGQVEERKHDLVVLSLGMAPQEHLGNLLSVETGPDGFVSVPRPKDAPCRTGRSGIFVAGTATGPKDIVDSIVEASAAATEASLYLRELRAHAVAEASPAVDRPPSAPERRGEGRVMPEQTSPSPRIGVYVCHCGGNISDIVDVDRLVQLAAGLPGVVVSRRNVFMCSDPGQTAIAQDVKKQHLDRVVVAACSPRLHETTFRRVLDRAGLNPYLYEHVNIREQVSWATDDPGQATAKAAALVAASVAKAARLVALEPVRVPTAARVVVVGGGVAGLRAAHDLARAGLDVDLVERKAELGGNVAVLDSLFPTQEAAADVLGRLVREALEESRITIHTRAAVTRVEGYVGNFKVSIQQDAGGQSMRGGGDGSAHTLVQASRRWSLDAGAIVVATGFQHYAPSKGEYGFGRLPQVMTLPDFIRWLAQLRAGEDAPELEGRPIRKVAFIHCVGSRQVEGVNEPQPDGKVNEYCSRVCCTATLQAICDLQAKRPAVSIVDFYQDIRAYGRGHEEYYRRAARGGAVFVRFEGKTPPSVAKAPPGEESPVLVTCKDGLTWGEEVEAAADLVVLAVGMQPAEAPPWSEGIKLSVGADRFLLEVHPKLRPVELAVRGIVVAGASQGPKDISEATASASAAAAKVVTLLSRGQVELDPFVAHVDAGRCEGRGLCVAECGYPGAITLCEDGEGRRRAKVNPALCAGCGACVAVCPGRAIDLAGWTLGQYEAMVDAILEPSAAEAR